MSLNDDAVADLGKPDAGVAGLVLQTSPDVKMYEPKPASPNANALLEMVQQTDSAVVQFKSVSDKTAKTEDMQEMMEEISSAGSISRSEADQIDNAFEGFYKSVHPSEFTRVPTRTNHKFAVSFMDRSLGMSLESLRSEFDTFFSGPLKDAKSVVKRIEETYLPDLQELLQSLSSNCTQSLEGVTNNKNLIFPHGEGFVDMRIESLTNVKGKAQLSEVISDPTINMAVDTFRGLWDQYGIFRSMMAGVYDKKPVEFITSSNGMISTMGRTFNLLELLATFGSPYLFEVVQTLYKRATEAIEKLQAIEDEGLAASTDKMKCQSFLVTHSPEIGNVVSTIHALSEAVATLLQVIPSVTTMIQRLGGMD